jgi:hypothetical protein
MGSLGRRFEERNEWARHLVAWDQDAEATAMKELKRGALRGHLLKKFPYAEFVLSDVSIVEKHNGVFGKLCAPKRKVILDIIIEVAAVDVQQVYRPIREIVDRIFEGRTNKSWGSILTRTVCITAFSSSRGPAAETVLVHAPRPVGR